MRWIDLNADVGEGAGQEAALMPLVSSANVCCGVHAGGPPELAATVRLALAHGVVIGAHPGHADREHFGRRERPLDAEELQVLLAYQLAAAQAVAELLGGTIRYVKPHGALYHQLCRERPLAEAFVAMVERRGWAVLGFPDSALEAACRGRLPFVREGYADRRYRADGTLVPRGAADAFVDDPLEAAEQVERLVTQCGVQSVCVHGDSPQAVAFTRQLRTELQRRGWHIRPFVATQS